MLFKIVDYKMTNIQKKSPRINCVNRMSIESLEAIDFIVYLFWEPIILATIIAINLNFSWVA